MAVVRQSLGYKNVMGVDRFKYMRLVVEDLAYTDKYIIKRTGRGWLKWSEVSGVLCDMLGLTFLNTLAEVKNK